MRRPTVKERDRLEGKISSLEKKLKEKENIIMSLIKDNKELETKIVNMEIDRERIINILKK